MFFFRLSSVRCAQHGSFHFFLCFASPFFDFPSSLPVLQEFTPTPSALTLFFDLPKLDPPMLWGWFFWFFSVFSPMRDVTALEEGVAPACKCCPGEAGASLWSHWCRLSLCLTLSLYLLIFIFLSLLSLSLSEFVYLSVLSVSLSVCSLSLSRYISRSLSLSLSLSLTLYQKMPWGYELDQLWGV